MKLYIKKYQEGKNIKPEENTEPIELDEVIVTPEDWQLDYSKNFGNKEIRSKVSEWAANRAMMLAYNKEADDESTHPYWATGYVKRLYDIWDSAGRPKIYRYSDRPWYMNPAPNTAFTKPFTSTIVIRDDNESNGLHTTNDIVAELAHPLQQKYGANTGILQFIRDFIPQIKNIYFDDNSIYKDPKSLEYETHKEIEPLLWDYLNKNEIPGYRGKKLIK